MASPFWGLYEDLPPPTTATSTPTPTATTPNTNKPDISEWTSNPKLAKLTPTAVRKKSVPMVPRAAHAKPRASPKHTPEPKSHSTEKHDDKPRENALSLVSEAYASDMQAMEVVEEYDPARPNEYDKYVSERMHRQKMEREEETRREYEEPKHVVDLSVSGEEAFNRRARLSGRPPSPPRTQADEDIDGEAMDAPPYVPPQSGSSPKESVAARMMAKMGWREGAGLGREEQGMTTALVHKKTDRKTAVIVNAPPAKPAARSLRIPPPSEQSKVILLKNMVGPGEVDDDLESETASECGKYGEVVKCLIFEVVGDLVGPTEAVRIYIHFTRQESALKAFIDLNGRFFGGRAVNASFFNEARFLANNLAPSTEELETINSQQT